MKHPLNRRSFLAQVMGVAALGGCATTITPNRVQPEPRSMAIDADPSDPARPPPPAAPQRTACSDSDTGAAADPAQRGRRCGSRQTGISDSDSGPQADPADEGRGSQQPRSRFIICPGHPRCPPRR